MGDVKKSFCANYKKKYLCEGGGGGGEISRLYIVTRGQLCWRRFAAQ